jgi:hypothetical protein
MEKGQRTDSGERLAPSLPKEIRYGEGAGADSGERLASSHPK